MDQNFSKLPGELQSAIFRLLDPIALVSFSQTSKAFREAISPSRQHLIERLLAIECLEQYGGPVLQFRSRDNALSPAWDDDRTDKMRWACTSCMRLLPHAHFDNHSLLRLGSRKPPPNSPAALPCTSWEPNGRIVSRTNKQKQKAARQAQFKKLRRQYSVAVTLNWGKNRSTQSAWDRLDDFQTAGIDAFRDMSTEEFELISDLQEIQILDELAESIERRICGYKRHLRKCNECRYQTGDLRWHVVVPRPGIGLTTYRSGANIGTEHVPIVRSRRLYFGTFVHRFFPGFFTNLPSHSEKADKAPTFPIHRDNACDTMFTLYMIRCAGCSSWKEMTEYRCGNLWPKWWLANRHPWGQQLWPNWDGKIVNESFIDNLRCHSCHTLKIGRDAFAEEILTWYIRFLIADTWRLHRHLNVGWDSVRRSIDTPGSSYGDWSASKQYLFDIRAEVLAGLPWKDHDDKGKGVTYLKADATMLHTLNQRHKVLKDKLSRWYVRTEVAPTHPASGWNDWFGSWISGYDNLEAQWVWFRDCKTQILNNPERLIEWALGDSGAVNVDAQTIWKQVTGELSKEWSSPEICQL